MGKYLTNRQGVALITTVMIVALVVTMVVEFSRITVSEIEVSKNFSDEKKITYLAVSSINVLKDLLMLEGTHSKGDTLLEEWANGRGYFSSASAAFHEGKLEGEILDECGKINLNSLVGENGQFDETQKKLWERLLRQPRFGLTGDQIDAITHGVKDWIDKDDEVTGIFGAEDTSYRSRGYRCRNGAFHTLEELLLVNGMTKEIFFGNERGEGIHPYFTAFGRSEININTAPVPILMAFSDEMTEDIAFEMDKFRRDETNRKALENKTWYKDIWPYGNPLPENAMTTSSVTFSVHMKISLRENVKEIKAIIFRPLESEPSLIYWQET
jgi:general secretion pathway protein K